MTGYNAGLLTKNRWRRKPFPHAIIDGLWDPEDLARAEAEFPHPLDHRWQSYADPEEQGKRAAGREAWGPGAASFFETARSEEFVALLGRLTGIEGLIGDEVGGGMHETGDGGRLGMHVDFNYHPESGWVRRLNVLVYLNRSWDCGWGGCLQLGENREVTVEPLFNRTVVFECSAASWHGHPDPVEGDHLRRSLATYYYTEPGSVDLGDAHDTVYHAYTGRG